MGKRKERKIKVKTWKVPLKNGQVLRVATIEHGKRVPLNCKGCPAPCCDSYAPVLTAEEFLSKKFPFTFTEPEEWFSYQLPKVEYLVTLPWKEKRCPFFDETKRNCKVWPDCPRACLAYDCREDPRPQVKGFVEKHLKEINGEKEWAEQ